MDFPDIGSSVEAQLLLHGKRLEHFGKHINLQDHGEEESFVDIVLRLASAFVVGKKSAVEMEGWLKLFAWLAVADAEAGTMSCEEAREMVAIAWAAHDWLKTMQQGGVDE